MLTIGVGVEQIACQRSIFRPLIRGRERSRSAPTSGERRNAVRILLGFGGLPSTCAWTLECWSSRFAERAGLSPLILFCVVSVMGGLLRAASYAYHLFVARKQCCFQVAKFFNSSFQDRRWTGSPRASSSRPISRRSFGRQLSSSRIRPWVAKSTIST